ncbi:MAG TPA: hypothetical protein VE010_00500 [Thermoanaerobaculia bacterium]|nr:hypothetical protein [Thermoanaerobaculia bacterium]
MRHAATLLIAIVLVAPAVFAHEGWGIVVDDRLGVIVADIPANTIWRVANGRAEPLARNIHSHELLIGPDGALYGSNPEPNGTLSSVWRIDASGRFSYVLPPAPGSPLGLQSFLYSSDGSLYSASRYDHRRPSVVLLRRRPNGEISAVAGGAKGFNDGTGANAQFLGIDGIRETPDGTLLVADGNHLRKVDRDRRVVTITPALTQRRWDEDLLGLCSVRGDFVHVADHAGRRVLRVNWKTGHFTEVARSGLFWAPAGVEQRQDLYILEHLRPPLAIFGDLQLGPYLRVRQVAPDGTSTTLVVIWGRRSTIASVALMLLVIATGRLLRKRRSV